jgi:protein O-GlcNAc transferase
MVKLSVEQALLRADSHLRDREFESARALYNAVLAAFPKNARAQQALARLTAERSKASTNQEPPKEDIVALIAIYKQSRFQELVEQAEKVIANYPSSFIVWNILASAQMALGELAEAENGFRKAAAMNPAYATAYNNMGIALKEQGKLDEAIAAYRRALEIKPAYAEAYNNMGNALKEQGKLDEAIAAYHRALEIKPAYAEAYNNKGIAQKEQGKLDEAIADYHLALEIKTAYAEAYNNMGIALKEQGKLDEAIAAYRRALEIKPTYAEAYNNMGVTQQEQGKLDEAIAAYRRALEIKPAYAEAYINMGLTLQEQGKLDEAIAAYHRALEIKPAYAIAEALMLHLKQHVCDFSVTGRLREASARLGIKTDAVPLFSALPWEDNPRQHRIRAMNWACEKFRQSPLPIPAKPILRSPRIKVGYLSADFHDHATMYLMGGLLRGHDRSSFETFAYSYGRIKSGEWRKRSINDVDHFFDIADQSDREIVDLVRTHALDLAIDLKGYTQHTRSRLFQYRLAPIQINYLGYPGSMGAHFFDYIIADPIVIPDDQRRFYSEKVIYLPHSYQPNDNLRLVAETTTKRADFGLPDDGFVFCCFNSNYKISSREFEIWMRLLRKIEDSVLWLLKSNIWAEQNLRYEAQLRGVDPNRLVFAEKIQHAEHLARHKHADLFLDTFNVNAHTTASDALWGGLPVVTKQGRQFAARVAASLLSSVGLSELITHSEEEYEELIQDLASRPSRLAEIREKLSRNRLTEPLFDTARFTRNYENVLQKAYDRYVAGAPPADIRASTNEV